MATGKTQTPLSMHLVSSSSTSLLHLLPLLLLPLLQRAGPLAARLSDAPAGALAQDLHHSKKRVETADDHPPTCNCAALRAASSLLLDPIASAPSPRSALMHN